MLLSTNAIDDRVRQTLVQTLYTQPTSLAMGAAAGILTTSVVAIYASQPAITFATVLLCVVAFARVALSTMLPRLGVENPRRLEIAYEAGAFSYAFLIGLIAAMTIHFHSLPAAQVLMVANAVGYATGIAARNAGRPLLAIGQMLLTFIPIVIVAGTSPEPAFKMLAVSVALLAPAMMSITINVFRVLRSSVAAAETSARLAERMQHLARTDVVTGLCNRAGLDHALAEHLERRKPGGCFALFWLDLDRFKDINDSLGHQTGDKILAEVARRLRARLANSGVLGRFGGDEFVIACEARDRREVENLALALLGDVCRTFRIDEDRIEIGCSIGVAMLPDDGDDLDTLMKGADVALYHAKVNGRKQVSFFDPSMTRDLVRRREIEAELRLALQRDELSIFFQPIVDLATGKIRAFEALVRWFHPEKGELRPDEFIPVAEETGAIVTLGNWITAQAAKAAAGWPEDVTVAVNLSPVQIKAPGAALGILNALREARLPPERLELEITETVLLDQTKQTEDFMTELAEAGVRFALDDFGTGYSSLGYLAKYKFGKIKVDRSFVSGINAGKTSDAIIRAVSEMALTLDMEIVAEGIETIEQVAAVRDAGCTLGQGYYFSRAVPDYLATMLLSQERDRMPKLAAG
ncbi:putative bifunctional diguanylate cyclase/phosphodiesterase [Parablastomonas sp. CN1-191]|uniref:putative bifunctional diguanylate cyclase/phosphodiesterase n=1 Tax=Parablastomonas sp. CN1-191 TaxID=3400908 RepID=UPI003BF83AA8